jgi:hypothetical protein
MAVDDLRGARIKLERANLHAGIARREARRFFRRYPEPICGIDPESESRPSPSVGEIFHLKIVVESGWPDLPLHFASRFGDAIHNYRCVLDHIAWQLVSHGATPPSNLGEWARRRVQFPIYDAEKAFDQNVSGRLPGVDKTIVAFVKSRHEYVGGQPTNDALLSLATLSNDDKHRTLVVIAAALLNARTQITFTRCKLITARNPPARPAVKDGAVLMLLECRATGLNPEVRVKFQPTFHIALEGGAGFGDVLAEIAREVTQILNAPASPPLGAALLQSGPLPDFSPSKG